MQSPQPIGNITLLEPDWNKEDGALGLLVSDIQGRLDFFLDVTCLRDRTT
jgi:hypothetical protein